MASVEEIKALLESHNKTLTTTLQESIMATLQTNLNNAIADNLASVTNDFNNALDSLDHKNAERCSSLETQIGMVAKRVSDIEAKQQSQAQAQSSATDYFLMSDDEDTSGPALNILMKLMAIISVVFADVFLAVNKGDGLIASWS